MSNSTSTTDGPTKTTTSVPSSTSTTANSTTSTAAVITTSTTSTIFSSTESSSSTSSSSSSSSSTSSTSSTSSSIPLSTSTSTVSSSTASPATVTVTPTSGGSSQSPIVVIQTITTSPSSTFPFSTTAFPASTSSAGLTSNGTSSSSGGLNAQGKIAIEVIVPIAAVALFALAGIWFWRKRKERKTAEDIRRKDAEEYGFNPNMHQTLPAGGGGGGGVTGPITHDVPYEVNEGNPGYRGWGATTIATGSTGRKPSTTMSGSGAGIGMAYSEGTSPHAPISDSRSGDTLINSPTGRPMSTGEEGLGAMGPAALAVRNGDVHRGPSNASSSYSGANLSDGSGGGGYGAPQYYNNEANYGGGGYGDGGYGGTSGRAEMPAQPVIRDNQARRAPRIENPSHFPTQGAAGISQNF